VLSHRGRVEARPNRLASALARRRAAGLPFRDLTVSNPTRAGIPYDTEAIGEALSRTAARPYEPEPFGLLRAREAVLRLWAGRGVETDPSRIALTASTSEAYAFLLKLLCDPGDQVAVPRPSYPLVEHLARYEGVDLAPYSLAYDGAWHVDRDSLRRAITERTRAVLIVSPNNPTGSYLHRDDLAWLEALGLPIVSDEVFAPYPLLDEPGRPASALEADGTLVFALDGLSKGAALPQMKLAWITMGGPAARVAEARQGLEWIADTFLSPAGPVQHALPALLAQSAGTRRAIQERLRANRDCIARRTAGSAVSPLAVEGGWYGVLRLPAVRSEETWVLGLLEEAGVLVHPGFFYDFAAEPFVVLSLLTPEADLDAGVAQILDFVGAALA
jgi:alanine-synthesizing transaminase